MRIETGPQSSQSPHARADPEACEIGLNLFLEKRMIIVASSVIMHNNVLFVFSTLI